MATASQSLPREAMFFQALNGEPQIEYSAQDLRYMLGAIIPTRGTFGDSFQVTSKATPDWSVDVSGGYAGLGNYVNGSYVGQEIFLVASTATINVPLTGFNTAPTATRTHKVWIAVINGTGGVYDTRIMITEDLGSGAPVPTATYYLHIASVTITPSQSFIAQANIIPAAQLADFGLWDTSSFTFRSGVVEVDPVRITLRGHTIHTTGSVKVSDNTSFVDGVTLIRLAQRYRHAVGTRRLVAAADDSPCMISVGTDGWLTYHRYPLLEPTASIAQNPYQGGWGEIQNEVIYLDGLSWDI